jgi:hypothetical protein
MNDPVKQINERGRPLLRCQACGRASVEGRCRECGGTMVVPTRSLAAPQQSPSFYVPHASVPRDAHEILCPTCLVAGQLNVIARVPCTADELREHNCGRSRECCARAFQGTCGHRLALKVDAPDLD